MAIIDYSTPIGLLLNQMNIMTGSLFITLLFLSAIIMFLCIGLRMPVELSVVVVYPLLIISLVATGDMFSVVGIGIIYTAVLVLKNWPFG